jgi:hypothetical protein
MASKVGAKPGEEYALTDKSHHTWAYTCLMDGRILVQSMHPEQGWGYYLLTPNPGGEPKFERIDCEFAREGITGSRQHLAERNEGLLRVPEGIPVQRRRTHALHR